MFHTLARVSLSSLIALSPLFAQSDAGLRSAGEPAAMRALLNVPLHRSPSAAPQEKALWAARAAYKVALEDGFELHPFLGAEAPRSLPLAWRTSAVRVGDTELAQAAEPRIESGAWSYALRHDGWTERYDVLEAGLEQSWVFERLPLDAGDLVIEGAIRTPLTCTSRDHSSQALQFVDAEGNLVLSYGAAIAFDAAGRTTTVASRCDGERIVLELASSWLREATLPVTVDPLVGPASFTMNTASGGFSSLEIACQRESAVHTQIVAFTRAFSAADHDAYAAVCDQGFANAVGVYYDSSVAFSDKEACAAYAAGADRWVVAYQRDFTNANGDFANILMYVHDRDVTTLNSGFVSIQQSSGPDAFTKPDLGGSSDEGQPRVLLVFQGDTTSQRQNTPNSEIVAVTFNAARLAVEGSFLAAGTSVGTSLDRELPAVNQVSPSYADGWMIVWSEWDHLVAVEDWDLFGTLAGGGGGVRQTNRLDDGLFQRHLRDARVAGAYGQFLVTYGVSPDLSTTTTVELRSRRFAWESNHNAPTLLASARTLFGPTSTFFPVTNGDLAFLTNTSSHWMASYLEARAGIQLPLRQVAHAARLGGTGAVVEAGTLIADPSISAVAPGVAYDIAMGRCNLVSGSAFTTGTLQGFHFEYALPAGVLLLGTQCGPATINGNLMHAGNANYGISISSAPPQVAAALLISLASANIPLDVFGMAGCTLAVAPGVELLASLALGTNANGYARLPLPLPDAPLFQGTFFAQWVYLNPGANALGVQATRGLAVSVY